MRRQPTTTRYLKRTSNTRERDKNKPKKKNVGNGEIMLQHMKISRKLPWGFDRVKQWHIIHGTRRESFKKEHSEITT